MDTFAHCFKAYDIRGKAPQELNAPFATALGQALASIYSPDSVVIGHDARLTSPLLAESLCAALLSQGTNVAMSGLCGTEEIYHAAASHDYDLGIMITASHNPAGENGFKLVRRGAVPIGADSGLKEIAALTARYFASPPTPAAKTGLRSDVSHRAAWLDWLLAYACLGEKAGAAPLLRVVVNAGNGCAGPVVSALAERLPVEIIPLNFEPDGSFPNGVPNPLLAVQRRATSNAVRANRADLGVAFDGDFDRCFFFDHYGAPVESCYLAGLLASGLLMRYPGEKVIHDPRVYWNTCDLVLTAGGIPVMSKGGHTFMKEAMRRENAIYGAEMSGHHFYRDFAYSDSGMLTMLLVFALLIRSGQTLAALVETGASVYPCSGELNFRVEDSRRVLNAVFQHYKRDAVASDDLDGINLEFPCWRFNLRSSNTEPLLRLNIESRGDPELVQEKIGELTRLINAQNA